MNAEDADKRRKVEQGFAHTALDAAFSSSAFSAFICG